MAGENFTNVNIFGRNDKGKDKSHCMKMYASVFWKVFFKMRTFICLREKRNKESTSLMSKELIDTGKADSGLSPVYKW